MTLLKKNFNEKKKIQWKKIKDLNEKNKIEMIDLKDLNIFHIVKFFKPNTLIYIYIYIYIKA
jgi:hypothetical protein